MAGNGKKALYVVAALASSAVLAVAQPNTEPVTGYAGMGTADSAQPRAGDSAPRHLTGEAPHPGDTAGQPGASGERVSNSSAEPAAPTSQAAPVEAAAPATAPAAAAASEAAPAAPVTAELPPEPASPTGLDAAPAAPVAVTVELPAAPAAPTGLDAAPKVAEPKLAEPAQPKAEPSSAAAPVSPAPAPVRAAEPAAPVAPADPLAGISQALARQLAVPTTGKDQEAIAAFYGARADAPVFVDQKGLTARGKAIIARFSAAGEDGLEPSDYKLPKITGTDPDQLAQAELRLAASALVYARHAQAGRFDPSRVSSGVTPTRSFPDQLSVLNALATASDASAALAAYNPPHAGYAALKAKLAEAQTPAKAGTKRLPFIPDGMRIRPGEVDVRVPLLRERLGLAPSQAENDRIYDAPVVEAVRLFQMTGGLEADGVVGAGTLAALNAIAAPRDRTSQIIANMERWRWLPRDLGQAHVMVNIPEYMVRIVDNGRVIHDTRVVVGKPETPTPLLTHDMEYVVVNPSWNVPPSIARKEMLPNLQRDPYYLARQGITIERGGRAVDPGSVNWAAGLGGYSFRQPPGERNALGRIKFMFPNQHSVYLHDTSSRSLFANERRAYSHGCVRVQDPLSFGEVVFSLGMPNDGWTEQKIGAMFGGKERYINLKRHIPVHLVYFTAFTDPTGRFVSRPDLYGIDAKVEELLGLDGPQHVASSKPRTATR
ncbi:L,D-transpeptidase family protein [Aquabacter cavernae]|uniref:L,D-transpeptidase family protein n=1 Tax=Aquabacter cavernae TaxID=2496029 RepID=UPI000F8F7557|nr:L,D-transpeptidase family protein [Aquabacter cavernae]